MNPVEVLETWGIWATPACGSPPGWLAPAGGAPYWGNRPAMQRLREELERCHTCSRPGTDMTYELKLIPIEERSKKPR